LLVLYKDLTNLQKVRAILEMEGEICSLDPSVTRVRQQVYLLQKEENFVIYKENCNCVEGMMKVRLNLDGTPRKHQKYIHEWAL
jgi:predicted nucleic acid-binding Zn finger protein